MDISNYNKIINNMRWKMKNDKIFCSRNAFIIIIIICNNVYTKLCYVHVIDKKRRITPNDEDRDMIELASIEEISRVRGSFMYFTSVLISSISTNNTA